MTDETTTRRSRPRRKATGYHKRPGMMVRLRPDVAVALEAEADRETNSKTAIIEGLLIDRYRLEA